MLAKDYGIITMYKDQTTDMLLKYACACASQLHMRTLVLSLTSSSIVRHARADTNAKGTRDLSQPAPAAEKVYETTERSWYTGSHVNGTQWWVPNALLRTTVSVALHPSLRAACEQDCCLRVRIRRIRSQRRAPVRCSCLRGLRRAAP